MTLHIFFPLIIVRFILFIPRYFSTCGVGVGGGGGSGGEGCHCFCLVSYTCPVYPFYFLNILELGMVELDLPFYFLCPLILFFFSSSQGQTLSK